MKKQLLALIFPGMLFLITIQLSAQISINTDGSSPSNSAMLDVKSSTSGLLPPRMNKSNRDAISSPAEGLIIFCTNCQSIGVIQMYSAGHWSSLNFNRLPVASNVSQSGPPVVGYVLTGSYTYADSDMDPEGTSTFRWYRADNASGLNEVQINGEIASSYTLTISDETKYIRFAVIPVAQTGDSPGDEIKASSFIGPIINWACGAPISDIRDGKSYSTILIGTQCWIAQNINIGIRINGSGDQTNNSTIEKYCYNNDEANCDIYGGLYQWNEMMNWTTSSNSNPSGRPGICLVGWHVPSDIEWCQLEAYLDATVNCTSTGWRGTDAGGKMKETGTSHWANPNTGATNSSGFTGLPGGIRLNGGVFNIFTYTGYFWSSTEYSSSDAWHRGLYYSFATVGRLNDYGNAKTNGLTVRCCKD